MIIIFLVWLVATIYCSIKIILNHFDSSEDNLRFKEYIKQKELESYYLNRYL